MKRMILVKDILNNKLLYIDIDKIIAIEVKPFVTDSRDGTKKQAPASILLDSNISDNKIIINETPDEFFKRMAAGTGCINIPIDRFT